MKPNDFSTEGKRTSPPATRTEPQGRRAATRRTLATAIVLLVTASPTLAHEGGSHKSVKGTVSSVSERQVVIRATDGKEQTILLDEDTECLDRQGDASCSDVKPGDRVVVSTRRGGKGEIVADEIKFSRVAGKSPGGDDHEGHDHEPMQGTEDEE